MSDFELDELEKEFHAKEKKERKKLRIRLRHLQEFVIRNKRNYYGSQYDMNSDTWQEIENYL